MASCYSQFPNMVFQPGRLHLSCGSSSYLCVLLLRLHEAVVSRVVGVGIASIKAGELQGAGAH